jgi:hypothetical protein
MDRAVLGQVTMGTGQMLLACVCLGGYSVALGRLAGPLGRVLAIAVAALAAVAFVARSASWETGVIVVALLPIGVALFAGAAWALWNLTGGRAGHAILDTPPSPQTTLQGAESAYAGGLARAPAFYGRLSIRAVATDTVRATAVTPGHEWSARTRDTAG